MKTLNFIRFAPCLTLLLVVSCASAPSQTVKNIRSFRESAAANVVLEHYRWDTIYLTRPDSHENGFYPILTHDNVVAEIKRRSLEHNLAVVILGHIFVSGQEATVIHEWELLLGDCGFQRVVFLRAGKGKKLDGLPIVHDSVIAGNRNDSAKGIASFTAAPSAR